MNTFFWSIIVMPSSPQELLVLQALFIFRRVQLPLYFDDKACENHKINFTLAECARNQTHCLTPHPSYSNYDVFRRETISLSAPFWFLECFTTSCHKLTFEHKQNFVFLFIESKQRQHDAAKLHELATALCNSVFAAVTTATVVLFSRGICFFIVVLVERRRQEQQRPQGQPCTLVYQYANLAGSRQRPLSFFVVFQFGLVFDLRHERRQRRRSRLKR